MYMHLAYLFYLSNYIINHTEFHPLLLKHSICFLRLGEGFMTCKACKVVSLLKLQHVDIIVSTKKRLAFPSFQLRFHTKSKILQDLQKVSVSKHVPMSSYPLTPLFEDPSFSVPSL